MKIIHMQLHFLGFISLEGSDWTFDCWVSNRNVWAAWRQMKPPFSGFSPEPMQLGKSFKSLLISWSTKLTKCAEIKTIQGSSATMWRRLRLPRGKITRRKTVRNQNYMNDKLSKVTEDVWRWGETGGAPLKLESIVTPREHGGRVKLRCRLFSPPWGDLRIKKKQTLRNVRVIVGDPDKEISKGNSMVDLTHTSKEPSLRGVESICPATSPYVRKRKIQHQAPPPANTICGEHKPGQGPQLTCHQGHLLDK